MRVAGLDIRRGLVLVGPADAAADVVRTHGQPQATLDPVAPQSLAPVTRDGRGAGPRVPAVAGGLSASKPVTYPDGVSVTVERIRRGSETGEGPGEFPGPLRAILRSRALALPS